MCTLLLLRKYYLQRQAGTVSISIMQCFAHCQYNTMRNIIITANHYSKYITVHYCYCRRPSRYVPYKGTFVPYDGTFGASDQGQMLDV